MKAFLPAAFLALAACQADVPASTNDASVAQAPAAEPTATAKAYQDEEKSDLLSWSLSYPAEVAAIPALADRLRAASLKDKAENLDAARSDKAERDKNGFDFHGYEQADTYELEGNTPRLLSVARNWYVFTGGAHPNHGTDAVLWDRSEGKEIAFADLLAGGASALAPLFARTYCRALDEQRREKRGPEASAAGPDDPFSKCPGFDELTIIPKGEAGLPLTTILIHADPYVAGPYVEGDYDIEIPVNERLLAALKPQYRPSFADPR